MQTYKLTEGTEITQLGETFFKVKQRDNWWRKRLGKIAFWSIVGILAATISNWPWNCYHPFSIKLFKQHASTTVIFCNTVCCRDSTIISHCWLILHPEVKLPSIGEPIKSTSEYQTVWVIFKDEAILWSSFSIIRYR